MSLTKERINEIAESYLNIKKQAESGKKEDIKKYNDYKNIVVKELAPLVAMKTNRYKKFSNYQDLVQDGFEALMSSFDSYDPKNNNFAWWAAKYIGTRVSRCANTHSTIRIPLKKTKEIIPCKVAEVPDLPDYNTPSEIIDENETKKRVQAALALLSEKQRRAVLMYHEFSGMKNSSIKDIAKELQISMPTCLKILKEAKFILKNKLKNYEI